MSKPQDSNHADMVQKFKRKIRYFEDSEQYDKYDDSFELEVPYNYYGNRGYADLLRREYERKKENVDDWTLLRIVAYEMKTSIQDVGETTRQVKKMDKYLPESEEFPEGKFESVLVILDTEENREIVKENIDYFEGIDTRFFDLDGEEIYGMREIIKREEEEKKTEDEESELSYEIDSDLSYQDIVNVWEREKEAKTPVDLPENFFEEATQYLAESKKLVDQARDSSSLGSKKRRRIEKRHPRAVKISELILKERAKKQVLAAYYSHEGMAIEKENFTERDEKVVTKIEDVLDEFMTPFDEVL